MGLFGSSDSEARRKQGLKDLEDARLRFVERAKQEGFAPQEMLLVSTLKGGLAGIGRDERGLMVVLGPNFGEGGEYALHRLENWSVVCQEYFIPGEGLGGVLGFGKKGKFGYTVTVGSDDLSFELPIAVNENCAQIFRLNKNPLLSAKRRRGDANIVWDLPPIEKPRLKKLMEKAEEILGQHLADLD